MNDQRAATALRVALLRERAQSVACRVAQNALDAAREELAVHRSTLESFAESGDGRDLVAAFETQARRAATVLASEHQVADAVAGTEEARGAWAQSAQRRQALEEAARRVELIRRFERDRTDQRAADDISGRRRGRR
jgi:hypothetical protein